MDTAAHISKRIHCFNSDIYYVKFKTRTQPLLSADMAAQSCTIQIFAVECGYLFLTLFLSNLQKCHNKSYIAQSN